MGAWRSAIFDICFILKYNVSDNEQTVCEADNMQVVRVCECEKENTEVHAMNGMVEVYEFLKKTGTYYLATVEEEQPRVRPFGTIDLFEDKLYIQTGKVKEVSKQIQKNGGHNYIFTHRKLWETEAYLKKYPDDETALREYEFLKTR